MEKADQAPRAVSGLVCGGLLGFVEDHGGDPVALTAGLGVPLARLRQWHAWFSWETYLALERRFEAAMGRVPDRYFAMGEYVVSHRRLGVASLVLRTFTAPVQAFRLVPRVVPRFLLAGVSVSLTELDDRRLTLDYRFPPHMSPTAAMAEVIRGQLTAGPTSLGFPKAVVTLLVHDARSLRYDLLLPERPAGTLSRLRAGARNVGRRAGLLLDLGGELLRTNALLGEKLRELEEANARLREEVASRQRAAAAARASEERYRVLSETAEDVIAVIDADLILRYVNRYGAAVSRRTPEEIVGRSLAELIPAERAASASRAVERVLATGEPIRRERSILLDRGERWFDVALVPFDAGSGGGEAVLCVVRDVTARKRAEQEQAALEAQMQQTQKLESLGVLAGGIAHDFNNLLTIVLGNAEVALEQLPGSHPLQRNLGPIADAARRGAELCRLMLAYAGKGALRQRAVDLATAVRDLEGLLRTSVPRKAELRFAFAEGIPPVGGDPTQLRQVALNLVLNASESLDGGPGRITVRTGLCAPSEAELEAAVVTPPSPGAPRYVFLEVEDTGCGMDEETRARAFDPFFTTKFTGRGLGLAAVLGIVRRHGGLLTLDTLPGDGTRIRVGFPEASGEEEDSWDRIPLAGRHPGEEPQASQPLRGSVLLVDDEREIREVGRSILEALGFEVLTAADGQEALQRFEALGAELRAVILDVTMPRMDGEEVFRVLRQRSPALPILLISGHGALEVEARFGALQPYSFLPKPYTVAELEAALRGVLEAAAG